MHKETSSQELVSFFCTNVQYFPLGDVFGVVADEALKSFFL